MHDINAPAVSKVTTPERTPRSRPPARKQGPRYRPIGWENAYRRQGSGTAAAVPDVLAGLVFTAPRDGAQ